MPGKPIKTRELFAVAIRPKLLWLTASGGGEHTVYTPKDIPGSRYFTLAIAAAVAVHLLGVYIWYLMPKQEVIEVPVRVLNVKLGDGDVSASQLQSIAPDAANKAKVESALSKLVKDERRDYARAQSVIRSMEEAIADQTVRAYTAPLVPQKYVRETSVANEAPVENNHSASESEIIARYEQAIAAWIQKFKLYPEDARVDGLQGETVIRVRIDRGGNVRHYMLERSTGHMALDRAAIDMIRRANPVPAVPHDYPAGELLEFLIPVTFRLE